MGPLIIGFKKTEDMPVVKAKSRIDRLKTMGENDALVELIAKETQPYISRMAAEALAELGDERGKKLLNSPIGKEWHRAPEPATHELGIRLLVTIVLLVIISFVLWGLSVYVDPAWGFGFAIFHVRPLIAGYAAHR